MCTVVILFRPDHDWPVLMAANRDEMVDRPWQPPERHWPDRPGVIAGRDELGGGTWLGMNDQGVVAAILNRLNTLGPAPGLKSRGDLPLEALGYGTSGEAATALASINPRHYRPFNMVIADRRKAFWVRASHAADGSSADRRIEVSELPPGLSMITAYDRNDINSPRIRRYFPEFEKAVIPDPEANSWQDWKALLASKEHDLEAGPGGALYVVTDTGFGTVSSSLIALPAPNRADIAPVWLFSPGHAREEAYDAVIH